MTWSNVLRAFLAVSFVATIGCDRLTKRMAVDRLAGVPGRSYFADTVRLEYAENTGGFLSLGEDLPPAVRRTVFVGGTGVLFLVVLTALARGFGGAARRELAMAGMLLFFAGGLSNWLDRLAHGRVVDFMILQVGPLHTGIFNVADVAIMIGAALMLTVHVGMPPDDADQTRRRSGARWF